MVLFRVFRSFPSKKNALWRPRFFHIINKASKNYGSFFQNSHLAQPRGKLAVICLLMSFPHPLQNRVPRVRILLPLPKTLPGGKSDWPGIPWNSGLFSCFWVVGCGLDFRSPGRVFCRFLFLFVSVSNFSVWHSGYSTVCW